MSRLILLVAVFFVSTAGLFAHQALTEATPLAIAAWRLGLASLFFLGLSLFGRQRTPALPLSPTARARLIFSGLCLALHFVTWFAALERTPIARATLLACTTPLWTTFGGFLLGRRRPTLRDGLTLSIAGIGLWLVTHSAAQTATSSTFLGDLLGLSAGFLFGCYLLGVEGLHETISSQRQVTLAYSVAAVFLWSLLIVRGGFTLAYSPRVWRALLGMTLGPQIIGHTLLNWSLQNFSSSVVAFSVLLEPIITALLAWLLLHQALTSLQMGGGLLVLCALALVIGQRTPSDLAKGEEVEQVRSL